MWFVFAGSSALLWGVGQVLTKRGLAGTTPLFNTLLATALGIAIDVPLALAGGLQLHGAGLTLLFAFLAQAGFEIYFYALDRGPVSITGTLIGCYPVATVVLSVVFLHERLAGFQIAGIALAVAASVVLAAPRRAMGQGWRLSWLGWGLLAAASVGTADFLAKAGIDSSNVFTFLLCLALSSVPVAGLIALLDRSGRQWPAAGKRALLPAALGGLGMAGGGVTLNLAFASGPASLVSPLSSSYVGVSALLAVLFLGERLTRGQAAGVALAALAVVLLGVGA